MTEEEARTIALRVYGESYPSHGAALTAAVKAGYRAGLEAAFGQFEQIDQSGEPLNKMWGHLGKWLNEHSGMERPQRDVVEREVI